MRSRPALVALLALSLLTTLPAGANAQVPDPPCVSTPRLPDNPVFEAQEAAFGFHDEEIVICSPGWSGGVHLAARLWVPAGCPGEDGCAGVVIAHGFGFTKEVTFADMYAAAGAGLYVLSYDVRGQGASGGQAAFLGRDDVADQRAVLQWWHANVRPTKTAVYGISQGGWLAWTAAIFNCGASRAARFDADVPCDAGKRWVDAIVPVQGPARSIDDGTCSLFVAQVAVQTRFHPAILASHDTCPTAGRTRPVPGTILDVARRVDRVDVPVYAVTSFYDRLVPPRLTTDAYRILERRSHDRRDVLFGRDVRLLISNDAHGDVGGNLAVVNDLFAWMLRQIADGPPVRAADVSIAQEWEGGGFRLERAWPIPGTGTRTLYLSRGDAGSLGGAPGGAPDELRNYPVPSSGPEVPGAGSFLQTSDDTEIPFGKLVFTTEPYGSIVEITGEPVATIHVSSANANGEGLGQLHLGLFEIAADGSVKEFSHGRVGLVGLGPEPRAVRVPLSVAGHRIDAGSRLMLSVSSSDAAIALPAPGLDAFFVHHDAASPSRIVVPVVPVARSQPSGEPPSGAAYTDDPVGAICGVLGLPC